MKKDKEKQWDIKLSVSKPSTMDLRGRQSVRATFRLSEACIDAISYSFGSVGYQTKIGF